MQTLNRPFPQNPATIIPQGNGTELVTFPFPPTTSELKEMQACLQERHKDGTIIYLKVSDSVYSYHGLPW